ncbi:mechanosensitive ion channel family protein [Riemerella columbipharyngis]|uniref:Mechanosensitive ion channel n=1 Tax=Riemerella columbipharyngis TaxID=1071918 RepID=A0A1G7ELY7_9FLAO|nr:mechanosensitive ion channel domain-containing protein [Riemerella columbipharyngis]SDE64743.1 Mechanosensitive ion channel [Riemerella columbipharyngis]
MNNDTYQAINTFQQSLDRHYENFIDMLPRIILGLAVIIVGVLISKVITNIYENKIKRKATDPLMAKFLSRLIQLIFVVIVSMLALEVAGLSQIAGGILAAAGGVAIVAGFAFQDIGKNFLAGIILAFNRPFNVDDFIKVGEHFGKVKAMNFRYTQVKTVDGRDIYIPNSDVLTKPVENYTRDGFYRMDFFVHIGYENNIEQAKGIIQKILNDHPDIIEDSEHRNFVMEDELTNNAVKLKVLFWIDTKDYKVKANEVRGGIIRQVKETLIKNGVNMNV